VIRAGRSAATEETGSYTIGVLFVIGCFVVLGVSVVYYFEGYCDFFECIPLVPYRHVPVALAFFAIVAKWYKKLWGKPPPPAAS
jgi:hypothetical protein